MIAYVSGPVASIGIDGAVVEVGGVGLSLQCTPGTIASLRLGQSTRLATSLIVREDSLTLYGFVDDDERGVFELLQTATGVGPRLAQAMLAVHAPDELRRAVTAEDLPALMRVPGVGRKGAQRIVLELKDKLGAPHGKTPVGSRTVAAGSWRDQVHGALLGLGYAAREADVAVEALVEPATGASVDVGAQLRTALRSLART